jgi:hypothetical protein
MATTDILVNEEEKIADPEKAQNSGLTEWVMERVNEWEQYRDENHKPRWDEYYRLWKGIWKHEDRVRHKERSKLISPALQQAIESTVAEVEEATFGKKRWFDIEEDTKEQQQVSDQARVVNELLEEFAINDVEDSISEVLLNAALYGTGIAKVVTTQRTVRTPTAGDNAITVAEREEATVKLVPIEPSQFVIDSMAVNIDEALGCAHIMYSPRHIITEKIRKGIYNNIDVGDGKEDMNLTPKGESNPRSPNLYTKIIEYHGLVPKELLRLSNLTEEEDDDLLAEDESEDDDVLQDSDDLVEAIVTIANDSILLRAIENPNFMKDRNIVAFQFEKVPNRFWGRGVAEKGYSPQKALDAELRARIDALAFALNPMMAINANNIPRDVTDRFSVYPGKSIITAGPIQDSIGPIAFNPPPTQSFTQSGDLERMIEMGTGAVQASAPLGQNPRNSTASGIGIAQSGFIKRSKRVLRNVERRFLTPLIKKAFWRYMQVDPERFPLVDVNFRVYNTLGIIARELEQQHLSTLLQTVPPESPAFWLLLKALYENSSLSNKEQMIETIDQMAQKSMQPKEMSTEDKVKLGKLQVDRDKAESDKVAKSAGAILDIAKAGDLGDKSILGEFQVIQELRANGNGQENSTGQNNTGGESTS